MATDMKFKMATNVVARQSISNQNSFVQIYPQKNCTKTPSKVLIQ